MEHINRIVVDGREVEPTYAKKKGIVLLRQTDDLVFVSGHGPEDQLTGKPLYAGRVGGELTPEEGYQAARECAIIILGALKDAFGDLDRIGRVIKAFGLVNCDGDFNDIEHVMDGFSDTVMEVMEERGYHARTVMGTHNLPNHNIPVEIEVIVSLKE